MCSSSCPGFGKYTGHSTYECSTLKGIPPDYSKLEDLKDSYQALMPLRYVYVLDAVIVYP